jgi:glycosyltransferase involved in cell wall biosynthesis
MIKVLIIGIGNPIPSFIYRRLLTLTKNGVKLTVVTDYGQELQLMGAEIVSISRKQNLSTLLIGIRNVFEMPLLLLKMLRIRKQLPLAQRIKWAIKYLPLLRIKTPDVIHIQWLSSVPEMEWLKHFFSCPMVASARGSQVTVYPFTRPGYRETIERAIQQVDCIHCVSNDIANVCVELGAPKEKIRVNYNGIDLQKFFPAQAKAKSTDSFVLISVGAMMWRKGFVYQLQVLKRLREKGDVKMLWIGEGPDREALQYQAIKLGVADHVTFAGKVKTDELPSRLNQADVYISTSAAEGLANSVVEASACGLPVVAFACEGMEEVLEDGVSGFILPFGDIEGLVAKIQLLMDKPELRIQMANAARQRMVEKFDEKKWVSHMIEIYKSIEKR